MRPASKLFISPYRRTVYASRKWYSAQPPTPRPYKQLSVEERLARESADAEELPTEAKRENSPGLFSWFFGRRKQAEIKKTPEPPDPARGVEASKRVVRDGVLDPKYRDASRRVIALICALPIAIVLGYELFQRRFMGAERKSFPKVKRQEDLR